MWDQKLFELFVNIIPQSFAFILLFFSLVGIKIEIKSFVLFSIGFAIIPYFIRPHVNFGVHSIISLFILILIAVLWGKANIISSIIYSIVSFAVAYVCEWFTFFLLEMSKFNMGLLDDNAQVRALMGLIPLTLLLAVGLSVYFIKKNINKKVEDKSVVI